MSVIIKGLNKFYSCRLCPFNNCDYYCNITKGKIDRDDYSCEEECPIVQLPKGHGRLIDEYKITKCEKVGLVIKDNKVIPLLVTDAPTLVDADRGVE